MQDTVDAGIERRFGGLDRLYGREGAARIRGSHVVVVGLGGVGSWAAEALARSGVGALTLIDLDHVSESNVNRQIHALSSTLGQAKVIAMQERIAEINPCARVLAVDEFVSSDNWPSLLEQAVVHSGHVTAVIDACDQARAKLGMAAHAMTSAQRFVTIGAAGGKRLAHRVEIDDLANVTHDPLMAQIRHGLRKLHGAPRMGKAFGVTCVFSREPVAPPDASCAVDGDGSLNCHGYGSVVTVTATFGQCAAGWVMDRIARDTKL